MTETFLPGDRISIEGTVVIPVTPHHSRTCVSIDGIGVGPRDVFTRRLTLVARPVVLPTNPYEYGPDPETGQPRWQVQVGAGSTGWCDVSGVTFQGGVWMLNVVGGWASPIGERAVRPVTR
jgi:hypothetical protein